MKAPRESPTAAVGPRLTALRERCGWSLRELAKRSGVTAPMISFVERGKHSPSLAVLHKLLAALGADLGSFFGHAAADAGPGPVFARERMPWVRDQERHYTLVFPRRRGVAVELLDERLVPRRPRPPFETLRGDVAGYLLAGELILEIRGQARRIVRTGDAFYVPQGTEHRGYARGPAPARLVTVHAPPRY